MQRRLNCGQQSSLSSAGRTTTHCSLEPQRRTAMAWWRLEWIKLKRKRTQKLFWQNKKLATAEKTINRTVENESCCLPSWTQCEVAATLKPLQLCGISEHFSANGLMESRSFLGVMKIAAHELQYRRGDGVDEITDHPAPTSPVMHSSITGRFSAALWGATKVHVKSFDVAEPLTSQTALKELAVLLELRHPGILLLMGVSYTGTTGLQLIFENISIGSLYHVLHVQQSNFTVEDICRIVIKLCEALRFMHQHLWLHLGLSSHALQLTAQGHYKLAAFELAKKQTHNSICRMSLEDARYQESIINWQAPEQCLGDPVGPETDIYTLSVMLQEMITGRVPWEQSKAKHVRRRYASGTSIRNQGWLMSAETHALLQRGLVVPRSQRTLTLDELEELCSKYLGPNVVAERRILAITANSRMKKPNRTSKLLSFQSVKRHLSSCQACTFNASSPDPLRKSEVYGKKVVSANYEEILQIPEEIYFDDHFDPSTKLGTHLQLLP